MVFLFVLFSVSVFAVNQDLKVVFKEEKILEKCKLVKRSIDQTEFTFIDEETAKQVIEASLREKIWPTRDVLLVTNIKEKDGKVEYLRSEYFCNLKAKRLKKETFNWRYRYTINSPPKNCHFVKKFIGQQKEAAKKAFYDSETEKIRHKKDHPGAVTVMNSMRYNKANRLDITFTQFDQSFDFKIYRCAENDEPGGSIMVQ